MRKRYIPKRKTILGSYVVEVVGRNSTFPEPKKFDGVTPTLMDAPEFLDTNLGDHKWNHEVHDWK